MCIRDRPRSPKSDADYEELGSTKHRLNEYCEAANGPILPSGTTPQRVLGGLLRLRRGFGDADLPLLEIEGLDRWADGDFRVRRGLAGELQSRLDAMGPPSMHVFRGSRRTSLLPSEERALHNALGAAVGLLEALGSKTKRLSALLEL